MGTKRDSYIHNNILFTLVIVKWRGLAYHFWRETGGVCDCVHEHRSFYQGRKLYCYIPLNGCPPEVVEPCKLVQRSIFICNLFYSPQQWHKQYSCLVFQQQCHHSSYLLCSVIHYCSTGWCCGALLYCEEEMWLPEVLLSDNSSQAAEATASTSVWWHCWPVSEHSTEGECRIWPCAAVNSTEDGAQLWMI